MELKVDELMSCIDEDWIMLAAVESISKEHIKELTLEKVRFAAFSSRRRRPLVVGILVALLIMILAAAAVAANWEYVMDSVDVEYPVTDSGQILPYETPDWGLAFSASNVSPSGLELICVQSGGDYSGQLMTGDHYYIERKTDSGWEVVSFAEENYVWISADMKISENEACTWRLDWSNIYGALPPGSYRLRKPVWELNGNRIGRRFEYCIEFDLMGGEK